VLRSNLVQVTRFVGARPKPDLKYDDHANRKEFVESVAEGEQRAYRLAPLTLEELKALSARVAGLEDIPVEALRRALTHRSVESDRELNNHNLAFVGDKYLSYAVSDMFTTRFPSIPRTSLHDAHCSVCNTERLFGAASRMGLVPLVRWRPPVEIHKTRKVLTWIGRGHTHADAVEALIALVLRKKGDQAARQFIFTHITPFPEKIDVTRFMRVRMPSRSLQAMCARTGRGEPDYRVIEESGRQSMSAVFVIGVFVDGKQLGAGTGRSLSVAKHNAALDALWRTWGGKGSEAGHNFFSK